MINRYSLRGIGNSGVYEAISEPYEMPIFFDALRIYIKINVLSTKYLINC